MYRCYEAAAAAADADDDDGGSSRSEAAAGRQRHTSSCVESRDSHDATRTASDRLQPSTPAHLRYTNYTHFYCSKNATKFDNPVPTDYAAFRLELCNVTPVM